MASIDITTQSGAVGNGDLQLQNGAPMDATLRFVTDAVNTASPLKLSTSLVQTTSTLKITTNDNPYIDAEDGSGNNRFTVGRAPASQQVNVDFASNPAGSTTAVGAIRTFRDGTNLSEAMTFIEDGSVGIGTTAPVGLLDLYKAAAATRLAIRGDAGQNRLISYRTGALQRFGLYVNNTAESGSNVGSDFAIRAYNDAGTLLSTPLFIQRSTGSVGINTTTPTYKLEVSGTFSSVGTDIISITDTAHIYKGTPDAVGFEYAKILSGRDATSFNYGSFLAFYTEGKSSGTTDTSTERMRITSTGNVGIGTSSPVSKLQTTGTDPASIITGYTLENFISTNPANGNGVAIDFRMNNSGNPSIIMGKISTVNTFFRSNADLVFSNATSDVLTEKARITSDGYLRMAASTGGIQFNGDTAAANALDDYEEGTFTATLTPSTSGTITLSPDTCTYTKIGRQVTVRGQIVVSAISSPVGTLTILGGLPFTSQNSVSSRGAGVFQYFPSVGSGSLLQNYQLQNSVEVNLILTASTIGAGAEFYISLTYFV